MDSNLTNELLQLQKSRSGYKYSDVVEDVKEIHGKMEDSIRRPLNSFSKNMEIISRYRGIMLYNLEKKFYASIAKLRKFRK